MLIPLFIVLPGAQDHYDSFKGFRSDYIHFSNSIVSPVVRARADPKVNLVERDGYSAFHFTPKGFAHFYAWWRSAYIRAPQAFPL